MLNVCHASIDVNGLKVINDGLGHTAGDERVVELAKIADKRMYDDMEEKQ